MFLLDTDTLTLLFYDHPRVLGRLNSLGPGERVAVSIVSRIEMLRGRFDSILKAADRRELLVAHERLVETERRLAGSDVLPIDAAAADQFDRLRGEKRLKKIGRPDLLIACIALAHRATLVTRNLKDYAAVPGLTIENWAD